MDDLVDRITKFLTLNMNGCTCAGCARDLAEQMVDELGLTDE